VISAIFFDLDDTLGVPVLSIDRRLERFEPFQFAQPVLKELREKNLRLGVISNTGEEPGTRLNEVLGQCALVYSPAL
jgi:FMN phosphatase YigB (HAD superfamily)